MRIPWSTGSVTLRVGDDTLRFREPRELDFALAGKTNQAALRVQLQELLVMQILDAHRSSPSD